MYGEPGKPCPSCGLVPMKRGILVKCCGSPGCTWLRCYKCGAYGHPRGRWLRRHNEPGPEDPHPSISLPDADDA